MQGAGYAAQLQGCWTETSSVVRRTGECANNCGQRRCVVGRRGSLEPPMQGLQHHLGNSDLRMNAPWIKALGAELVTVLLWEPPAIAAKGTRRGRLSLSFTLAEFTNDSNQQITATFKFSSQAASQQLASQQPRKQASKQANKHKSYIQNQIKSNQINQSIHPIN